MPQAGDPCPLEKQPQEGRRGAQGGGSSCLCRARGERDATSPNKLHLITKNTFIFNGGAGAAQEHRLCRRLGEPRPEVLPCLSETQACA